MEDDSDGSKKIYSGSEYVVVFKNAYNSNSMLATGRNIYDEFRNDMGTHEVDDRSNLFRPMKFTDLEDHDIKKVELADTIGFALDNSGVLWSWGKMHNFNSDHDYMYGRRRVAANSNKTIKLVSDEKGNNVNKVDYF